MHIEGRNINLYGDINNTVVPGQFPIIEFTFGFEDFRLPNHSPCFQEEFNGSVTYGGVTTFIDRDNRTAISTYNRNCETFDDRWIRIDAYSESSILGENFLVHPRCADLPVGTAYASDYWTTGKQCSMNLDDPAGAQCEYKFPIGHSCAPDDTICSSIMHQSACGHLLHFMTPSVAIRKMALYGRQQIYWASKCDGSESDLKSSRNPTITSTIAETWLLSIDSVCDLAIAITCILLLILFTGVVDMTKITGKGDAEVTFVFITQTVIPVTACIVKMLPTLACIVVLSKAVNMFLVIKDNECSDPLTLESIKETGHEFPM